MADRLEEFQKFRAELNEEILNCGHLGIKRFFALDHQAYEPGALPTKTKELLGLVASSVLRCSWAEVTHSVRPWYGRPAMLTGCRAGCCRRSSIAVARCRI